MLTTKSILIRVLSEDDPGNFYGDQGQFLTTLGSELIETLFNKVETGEIFGQNLQKQTV